MNEKRRKRNYVWFVAPENSCTDDFIIEETLQDVGFSQVRRIRLDDGTFHDAYLVSYRIIKQLFENRIIFNLKFRIFVKEGRGLTRNADFLFRYSKKSKSK